MLREARFVQARLYDPVHVLWGILEPRDSLICAGPEVSPGLLQDCVVVDAFMVGCLSLLDGTPHVGRCSASVWSLEAQDHALGRLLQRDPSATIDDVLWEAHTAVLNMNVQLTPADATFFLPGGHGGFSHVSPAPETEATDSVCISNAAPGYTKTPCTRPESPSRPPTPLAPASATTC
jgi:hypothetical protein